MISPAPARPRRGPTIVWLVAVWAALWQDAGPATLAGGAVVAAVLVWLVPPAPARHPVALRPLAALRFAAGLLWRLIRATAVVAWEVVTPRNRIVEGIVAVPLRGVWDTVTAVVAYAVSLTPGTLTLEISRDPVVLYVHVLHLRDLETARADVQRLEELAVRAFGPRRGAGAVGAT